MRGVPALQAGGAGTGRLLALTLFIACRITSATACGWEIMIT